MIWFLGDENHASGAAGKYIRAKKIFWARQHGIDLEALSKEDLEKNHTKAEAALLVDLYKNLDSIDTKASGALTFSGLVLTSLTIAVVSPLFHGYGNFIFFIMILTMVSAVFAASVIWVHWSPCSELEDRTLMAACLSYYRTRRARTARYQLAIALQMLAILLVAIGVIDLLDPISLFKQEILVAK